MRLPSFHANSVVIAMNKPVNAGAYDVSWNGRNTNGKIVLKQEIDVEQIGHWAEKKKLLLHLH